MNERLFKRAYDAQEQLLALDPQNELASKKYMHRADDCYQIRIDSAFLIKYQQNGTERQIHAFTQDLETAITKAQAAKVTQIPAGH